ncbi:alpha/beta-hydrolase [Trichocladium antarcticum]|uniref:Alpha/beta-hydrolase n=1 Tax=Trichocladium antarcticum TaxID=1450529 RepID=A0AAN6ZER8_9PEZI|nr:alpha/beta-hydrolase [Trichocladium antarcticum]
MIDHLLGRPSVKSRRLQVLAVLIFWTGYVFRGNKHGPPLVRFLSSMLSKRLTAWQTVVITMIYLYVSRNFSTLVGLASPDPLTNMYDATYFRATWVLTALDAGFWTAMKISNKSLRDLASMAFSVFYLIAAEQADEKVRKVRGKITVEHLRVSWNKGIQSPYLRFLQGLLRPRLTKFPARAVRIPRPANSDYQDPVTGWLYFDGPLSKMAKHTQVVLDIPGGGFVAMDPRCSDDKLFAWAAKTGMPILSLDYKKAPEYPYPYALNECYDVYTTLIKTRGRCIGLSGDHVPKVVITGDSAGGNLATSTTLMIIESGTSPVRRFRGGPDLPVPHGLVLFYPALDVNIGSWMSDEQMALIKDRRMRKTNKSIIERKTFEYNDLVGTPHQSDDEDEAPPLSASGAHLESEQSGAMVQEETNGTSAATGTDLPASTEHIRSPASEYAHSGPTTWSQVHSAPPPVSSAGTTAAAGQTAVPAPSSQPTTPPSSSSGPAQQLPHGASHVAEPMHTRLATSSMISYFNDRVLTPEMMRAMIILYIGRHNKPDFTQDYLLSPILAPDALLARFPKTYFLTGERDPLVDDTVIFAGRLRRVRAAQMASGGARLEYRDSDAMTEGFDEKEVAEVVLIPGISHGFLQFPSVYPPAWGLFEQTAGWIGHVFAVGERRVRQREREREREMGERRGRGRARARGGGGRRGEAGAGAGADLLDGLDEPLEEGMRFKVQQVVAESSGDEEALEMAPVVLRGRARTAGEVSSAVSGGGGSEKREAADGTGKLERADAKGKGKATQSGTPPAGGDEAASGGEAKQEGGAGGSGSARRRKKGKGRTTSKNEQSLIKLASTDDLLQRRMEGLAGGLTGLQGDPE